jgi:hypothetical protein
MSKLPSTDHGPVGIQRHPPSDHQTRSATDLGALDHFGHVLNESDAAICDQTGCVRVRIVLHGTVHQQRPKQTLLWIKRWTNPNIFASELTNVSQRVIASLLRRPTVMHYIFDWYSRAQAAHLTKRKVQTCPRRACPVAVNPPLQSYTAARPLPSVLFDIHLSEH